jgi:hypothetical protein
MISCGDNEARRYADNGGNRKCGNIVARWCVWSGIIYIFEWFEQQCIKVDGENKMMWLEGGEIRWRERYIYQGD